MLEILTSAYSFLFGLWSGFDVGAPSTVDRPGKRRVFVLYDVVDVPLWTRCRVFGANSERLVGKSAILGGIAIFHCKKLVLTHFAPPRSQPKGATRLPSVIVFSDLLLLPDILATIFFVTHTHTHTHTVFFPRSCCFIIPKLYYYLFVCRADIR